MKEKNKMKKKQNRKKISKISLREGNEWTKERLFEAFNIYKGIIFYDDYCLLCYKFRKFISFFDKSKEFLWIGLNNMKADKKIKKYFKI